MKNLDFGLWRGEKRTLIAMSVEEDGIFERLQAIAFENLPSAKKDGEFIFPE